MVGVDVHGGYGEGGQVFFLQEGFGILVWGVSYSKTNATVPYWSKK